jgi:hypothetical protein
MLEERRKEMEEIEIFLTEAMGDCWHDWKVIEDTPPFRKYHCDKCDTGKINPEPYTDFLTWEGFGKLWTWAIKQEWWYHFKDKMVTEKYYTTAFGSSKGPSEINYGMINPENFAKSVAHFLQKK